MNSGAPKKNAQTSWMTARWRALNAGAPSGRFTPCGHVLVRAAAEAHNGAGSATAFWRAFARKAEARGGYDAEMFFELAEEAGGEDLADAMRRFESTHSRGPTARSMRCWR